MGNPVESTPNASLRLSVLEGRLAICRLDPLSGIPAWATGAPFFSVTRTFDELSVVCPERKVPAGVAHEGGWRALKLEGPFDFGLAESGVGILAMATYDTDYVLVEESQLDLAVSALRGQGHEVR
jgi:uncharacterized protein